MITTISIVNMHHQSYRMFFFWRELWCFITLSNVQTCNILNYGHYAVRDIPELVYFITGTLHFDPFTHFYPPHPLPLLTTHPFYLGDDLKSDLDKVISIIEKSLPLFLPLLDRITRNTFLGIKFSKYIDELLEAIKLIQNHHWQKHVGRLRQNLTDLSMRLLYCEKNF